MATVINTKQAKNAKVEGKVCVKDDDFVLLDKVAATNTIEKKTKKRKETCEHHYSGRERL